MEGAVGFVSVMGFLSEDIFETVAAVLQAAVAAESGLVWSQTPYFYGSNCGKAFLILVNFSSNTRLGCGSPFFQGHYRPSVYVYFRVPTLRF